MHGKTKVGVRSDGVLALQGKTSSWNGGGSLNLKASQINLNGAPAQSAGSVSTMAGYKLADTKFIANQGWTVQPGTLETIVTRAPTHEPYPYHSKGVNVSTNLNGTAAATSTSTSTATTLQTQGAVAYERASTSAVQKPISAEDYVAEPPAVQPVPQE